MIRPRLRRVQISRRDALRSTAALSGLTAIGGLGLADAAVAGTARVAAPPLTTSVTLVKDEAAASGWRRVVRAAGDRRIVRSGLGARPHRGRAGRRRSLIAFAQLSDVHIIDAQSPVRLEFGEDVSPSAYRPQELLSGHVADAMVKAINRTRRGPATGRRIDFAIQTGDNSDTAQWNELRWNIDILDGGRTVRIDSGASDRYEGVMDQEVAYYNTAFWHPEGTPEGQTPDLAYQHGFPEVPDLFTHARAPFKPVGLSMPWYAAMGNHDGLVQGNFAINDFQLGKATGTTKLLNKNGSLSRQVTADPRRRLLDRSAWVEEHFTTTGTPRGHGFTTQNRQKNTAYYFFDKGVVRNVVLDTVAPSGQDGAMDDAQLAWLTALLDRSRSQLVVLYSHHPLASFPDKDRAAVIKRTLLRHENVVAWVNGHTHTNQIWAHPRSRDGRVVGGFWEINTASHIDWPQQARLLEIADNRDGTISIFATMLDHVGAIAPDLTSSDPRQLAGLSRLIAANDWQEQDAHREGTPQDRNVELMLPAPKFLRQAKR